MICTRYPKVVDAMRYNDDNELDVIEFLDRNLLEVTEKGLVVKTTEGLRLLRKNNIVYKNGCDVRIRTPEEFYTEYTPMGAPKISSKERSIVCQTCG